MSPPPPGSPPGPPPDPVPITPGTRGTASISVIIPVLQEAGLLESALPHWRDLQKNGAELIVVDGGSTDGTAERIRREGFTVLQAARGRARQMNVGAEHSSGALLVFLHADTHLPGEGLAGMRDALSGGGGWGRFDVAFREGGTMLRLVAASMNLRSRLSGIATGDQAIFLRRDCFDRVGGFPDQPLMEDVALSARLRALGAPVCLRARVITSARRWQRHGTWPTILTMWGLRLAYALGVPSTALARFYR